MTLSHHIEQGWIQVFCVDSVDAESWWNMESHPKDRALRHLAYHKYIIEEVLPFTKTKNENDFVIALGASMGAHHAILIFRLDFPQSFNRCLAMSGPYDFAQMSGPYNVFNWVFDYYDDNINQCNPVSLIKTSTSEQIEKIKKVEIIFPIGRTDPLLGSNEMLSEALAEKDIRCTTF